MAPLLLVLLIVAAQADYRRFDGDKVVRCEWDFTKSEHKQMYQSLIDEDRENVDLWGHSDIRLPPHSFGRISAKLQSVGVFCKTIIENVQVLVDAERIETPAPLGANITDVFFNNYRRYEEVHDYYASLQRANPTITSFGQFSQTYERRPIMMFNITANKSAPIQFIECGIHSREWITVTTCAYLAANLLQNNADANKLRMQFQWNIVPIVNVDGYAWTWDGDRMWRKTRRPNERSTCIGTDPNRNWANHWCEQGGSTNACSDSYCGNASFSQQETAAMGAHLMRNPNIKMFIDYHAYGQLWMGPWGWTGAIPPNPDGANQTTIGNTAVNAIKSTSGLTYKYGTIYNVVYPASGSSADYAYDNAKVVYAYGVELRDTGTNGFTLPTSQIRPQGDEIWAATVAMAARL